MSAAHDTVPARVCWGHFDDANLWHPNHGLNMSPEEQLRQNVASGYCTPDGRWAGPKEAASAVSGLVVDMAEPARRAMGATEIARYIVGFVVVVLAFIGAVSLARGVFA